MRKALFLIALMLCPAAKAQVNVSLSPLAKQQFLSQSGAPLAGGCLFTYRSGTSTPLATYSEGTGTFSNSNPAILDAGGFTTLFLTNNAYRFTLYSAGGVNCATGTFQYTVDNVNAYSVISQAQNIFLAGSASDPSGTAGELAYRTDIPCFRGFTTLWDCFVTLTATQTLTNKTLTAPTITGAIAGAPSIAGAVLTNPSVNGVVMSGGPAAYLSLSNDGTTGTTINTLTKMLGATAVISASGDSGGSIGITVAGAGKTGLATIQQNGAAACVFDNSTTAGDYVQISSTVAGNCHDIGVSYPASGEVIGRASVTAAAGTNGIVLFGPEIKPGSVAVIGSVNLTAQAASIGSTTIITPAVTGFYRVSCYIVLTQVATVSSTLPVCTVGWADGDTSVSENMTFGVNTSANTLGLLISSTPNLNPFFYAKSGSAITYATAGYASSGATPMTYALHLRLEGPF